MSDRARECAEEIWRDICDRRGLKWEANKVDDEVRDEQIFPAWSAIIRSHFPEKSELRKLGALLDEAADCYEAAATRIHEGSFHQWKRFELCTESDCRDRRAFVGRLRKAVEEAK